MRRSLDCDYQHEGHCDGRHQCMNYDETERSHLPAQIVDEERQPAEGCDNEKNDGGGQKAVRVIRGVEDQRDETCRAESAMCDDGAFRRGLLLEDLYGDRETKERSEDEKNYGSGEHRSELGCGSLDLMRLRAQGYTPSPPPSEIGGEACPWFSH